MLCMSANAFDSDWAQLEICVERQLIVAIRFALRRRRVRRHKPRRMRDMSTHRVRLMNVCQSWNLDPTDCLIGLIEIEHDVVQ